jgi:hypothetical protein
MLLSLGFFCFNSKKFLNLPENLVDLFAKRTLLREPDREPLKSGLCTVSFLVGVRGLCASTMVVSVMVKVVCVV